MTDKGQSKWQSVIESIITTICGAIVAILVTQLVTDIPISTNMKLTAILTTTSIGLKIMWRRLFNIYYIKTRGNYD